MADPPIKKQKLTSYFAPTPVPGYTWPLDVLCLIAGKGIKSYRVMLAIPQFGRHTIKDNLKWRLHFLEHTKTLFHSRSRYEPCRLREETRLNGRLHNENDLPAVIMTRYHVASDKPDIGKRWFQHGMLHRVGKPAMTRLWSNDDEEVPVLYAQYDEEMCVHPITKVLYPVSFCPIGNNDTHRHHTDSKSRFLHKRTLHAYLTWLDKHALS
jgi:hypothetical protein